MNRNILYFCEKYATMIGNVYIDGTIGDLDEGKFTELVDVIAQVNKQKEATSYKVHINTVGGYTYVAKQIRNYLKSLGKVIHTHGIGIVASSGTIIHSAGTIRTLETASTPYMIHLPSGGIEGTSEEIYAYSEMMQKEQKEIIDIYIEDIGLSKEALIPLLSNETWLTPKQAYDLGFLTEEPIELKAIAKYNKPVINKDDMSEKKVLNPAEQKMFKGFIDKLTTMFSGEAPKNIVLQTANPDVEIDFPELVEGDTIVVDTPATINGEKASGEYAMPSGETYVFTDGVLSEIKPKEEEEAEPNKEDDEFAKLLVELGLMKVANADLTNKLETAKNEFNKFKATLKTNFDFSEMKTDPKKSEEKKDATSQYAKNLAKKRKNRFKK